MAEDQRFARAAYQRADRAAVDVHRGATRGHRTLARGGAACAGDRELEMVEGGAPRRLPRLQPERQGPDHLLGIFRAAVARCCLLYTSDAADERSSVDLGGRR